MLDRLEASDLVVRIPSREDRRRVMIRLAEMDRPQEAYTRISREMASLAYRGFSGKEIDVFEEDLGRVLDNLRGHGT